MHTNNVSERGIFNHSCDHIMHYIYTDIVSVIQESSACDSCGQRKNVVCCTIPTAYSYTWPESSVAIELSEFFVWSELKQLDLILK